MFNGRLSSFVAIVITPLASNRKESVVALVSVAAVAAAAAFVFCICSRQSMVVVGMMSDNHDDWGTMTILLAGKQHLNLESK